MPSLPKQWVSHEADDGTEFKAQVAVDVLSDGVFSVEIPEPLMEVAVEIKNGTASVRQSRGGARPRVYAKALADALGLLKQAAIAYLNVSETTERVIVYTADLSVCFWQDGKSVYPNGYTADEGVRQSGQWWRSKLKGNQMDSNHSVSEYRFGVGAAIFDKITTKRPTGEVVRYEYVRGGGAGDCFHPLNSFCALEVNPENYDTKQMPYTPEAAQFFHDLLLQLCRMARSLDDFLSDDKKLKQAIASGNMRLLTGGQ